jgi:hypothetical protein
MQISPICADFCGYLSSYERAIPHNENLNEILVDINNRQAVLFVYVESHYIPWHSFFQTLYRLHCIKIVETDSKLDKTFVIDWIPTFNDWVDFKQIDQAYIVGGSQCFELTEPSLNVTSSTLLKLLRNSYQSIIGESNHSSTSGIQGLLKYKDDLSKLSDNALDIIDLWWDSLTNIVEGRDRFLEFIHFLNNSPESIFYSSIDPNFIEVIDQTILHWIAFRNGLQRSVMKGVIDTKKNVDKLEKIINLEEQCAEYLLNMIGSVSQNG